MARVAAAIPRQAAANDAPPPGYAELHCLSAFSFLRGISTPEELVHQACALGYSALALTDECSLAGVVRAWAQLQRLQQDRGAETAGAGPGANPPSLQLVFGSEFRFAGQGTLVALVRGLPGWQQLCRFITECRAAALKGQYALPPLDQALSALPGCELLWAPEHQGGELPDAARQAMSCLRGGLVTLLAELQADWDDALWLDRVQALAAEYALPVAAAGRVCMHRRCMKRLQDVATAVRLNRPLADCGCALQANAERHLRPRGQLARIYPPALLRQTLVIASRCRFDLRQLCYVYPQESLLPGLSPTQTLARLTQEGAAWRFPQGVPAQIQGFMDKELALIADCGYEMFFLTVHDIVREARRLGILCQGRGSAANSVVCYCLGITEADPRHSHPLLERFISKARRHEPPDIDVDFEHERREEIIQYIYRRYGRDRAALAASVISWRTRSALRDVGLALGLDARLVDAVARTHRGFAASDDVQDSLQKAAAMGVQLSARVATLWWALARQLKGRPRHLSQHVGGFVLTQTVLNQLVPVEPTSMPDRQVIQWDKDDLEALGWLKVDILALGMLTAIRRCLQLASGWHGRCMTRADITSEDPATYAMICQADTVGVFQIESRAQMSMLPRLRPTTFYDLVVQVAIVRPGPVTGGMVHPYLQARERRRRGLPISYERSSMDAPGQPPRLAAALERTLGIPIFQEQVMQLSMLAAGFSAEDADRLRRAMATWKKRGGLEPFRDQLVAGMTARGYRREFAERLFEQIQGFGDYGFPESHAYSFALVAYESAWLKCHEPEAWLAAMLNSQPMGFYAPSQLVQDARRHGVQVLPPDVGASGWDCSLQPSPGQQRPAVRLGLRMVKGLAQEAARRICTARAQAPFASVQDLARRAGLDTRALRRLAAGDALASLAGHRRQQAWQAEGMQKMPALLQAAPVHEPELDLGAAPEGSEIVQDYAALGLSLRRHPLALLRGQLAARRLLTARQLGDLADRQSAAACGLVISRQRPHTAKGTIFVTLEDETGQVNVIVWKNVRTDRGQRQALLQARLLAVQGRWQRGSGGVCHLIAHRFTDLTPLLGRLACWAPSRDFH